MRKSTFFVKMIAASLLKRRGRMLTALLAVSIGSTVLCGLLTLSFDIPRQMGREFRSYGANLIVYPQGDGGLSGDAVQAALSRVPSDALVGAAPYRYQLTKINERPFVAAGTDLVEARKTSPWWFVLGRWPSPSINDETLKDETLKDETLKDEALKGEALIGKEISQTLQLAAGSVFTPADSGLSFTVTGILETGGVEESFFIVSLADFAKLDASLKAAAALKEAVALTDTAALTGEAAGSSGEFAADVLELSVARNEAELAVIARAINENVPGVEATLVKRLTASEGGVLTKLGALTAIVTLIVLLLTMICVATTMISVVAERRREIGLKKALGAANRALFGEFLGEAVFLGLLGGLLGAILGLVFAQSVSVNVFHRPIAWRSSLAPLTITASALITALSSLLPLKQAVSVDPVVVLRGE